MAIKKEQRLLRIGVLGCGPISQIAHFDACQKARNAMLYAVCDIAPDLRERARNMWEPEMAYDNFETMLVDPKVDAVIIAVADQYHVPIALQAICAGKHVFVEKPLGVSIEECAKLQEMVRESKLVLQVGNNRRFDPGVAFARSFIQNELGEAMSLKVWYYDSAFRYTMTDNLQPVVHQAASPRRPEGNPKADRRRYYLLTHGSHLVDAARYLGGELKAVRARFRELAGAYCWFIETDFRDGALGHLDMNIAIQGDFEEGFAVYGTHGSAKGHAYLPWFHKSSVVECFSSKDRIYRRPLGEDACTYKLQIEDFADTILKGGQQRGATVEDGLAAVRALVAIYRSAATGATVALDDVSGAI
jgi:predicted dehydrogenase